MNNQTVNKMLAEAVGAAWDVTVRSMHEYENAYGPGIAHTWLAANPAVVSLIEAAARRGNGPDEAEWDMTDAIFSLQDAYALDAAAFMYDDGGHELLATMYAAQAALRWSEVVPGGNNIIEL